MQTSSARISRRTKLTSGLVGLLLAGIAATPAHAETIRSLQWHLDAMKADEMWKVSTGKGVTVAVIDSGVEVIPELEGQVLPGMSLSAAPGGARVDVEGHGTGIAAVIAGTGKHPSGDGAYGLAPGVKILPIRFDTKAGKQSDRDYGTAIRYAADSDAKVINMSNGGPYDGSETREAVKYALSKGKLLFAAVGNNGNDATQVAYPAGTPGVVGVAAVDKNFKATKASQTGAHVDLAAPGMDIVTACTEDSGLCKNSGTSDASAFASASAALIWSKYPKWTNNQVLRVMINTAGGPTSGAKRNDYIGYGMVRPRIPLSQTVEPGPADEYPLPDLAAAEAKSPSPVASKADEDAGAKDDGKPAATAPAASGGGDTGLWIGLGVAAAAVIGAAVAVPVYRSRRRSAAVTAGAPNTNQPPYPPHGQPQWPVDQHRPQGPGQR
ncbi:type VII secretion-associated serine protease mycosin [Streptomyces sp. SP18CS02]|uniref:type VII secretion-associated serine protease mycosin n=1 Tax=Streptomyces sp. SP18CS02 TaxID=3002531 RepID=UPI002E78864D|nr:type VII secretion-associated serine protease mycosin [Streptomyces sp. SP18CS02]MEE1752260.1 type VII secretion-associated serine protease mycosin [Streptomyces sp. SP18CS02]